MGGNLGGGMLGEEDVVCWNRMRLTDATNAVWYWVRRVMWERGGGDTRAKAGTGPQSTARSMSGRVRTDSVNKGGP